VAELAPTVGGVLYFEYTQGIDPPPHPIHLAVAPFDPTPTDPDGDYLYTASGPTSPTETGIVATAAAIAALWAPHYGDSWFIQLVAVYQNVEGMCQLLPTPRAAPQVQGTDGSDHDQGIRFRRALHLYTPGSTRSEWTIYLQQIADTRYGKTVEVSPSSGGFDARDQAWYAYLGSLATGVVGRNGLRFQPGGTVRQWADLSLPDPGFDVNRDY
jgi:hypothetical protein